MIQLQGCGCKLVEPDPVDRTAGGPEVPNHSRRISRGGTDAGEQRHLELRRQAADRTLVNLAFGRECGDVEAGDDLVQEPPAVEALNGLPWAIPAWKQQETYQSHGTAEWRRLLSKVLFEDPLPCQGLAPPTITKVTCLPQVDARLAVPEADLYRERRSAAAAGDAPRLDPALQDRTHGALRPMAVGVGMADRPCPALPNQPSRLRRQGSVRHGDDLHRVAAQHRRYARDLLQADAVVESSQTRGAQA